MLGGPYSNNNLRDIDEVWLHLYPYNGPAPPDQAPRAGGSRPTGMTGVAGLKLSGKGRA